MKQCVKLINGNLKRIVLSKTFFVCCLCVGALAILDVMPCFFSSVRFDESGRLIGGTTGISVKNTIETSVLDKNKDMETSKQDKKHHGYGMKSIKEIVNKYEGSMELEEKEGEFINDILLKMEKITG